MTVSGQTSISYGYDNANRLTGITQGSTSVVIAPDIDSRRQSVTLPNGVSMNYGYDAASQLTGITYKLGTNTLGNLTYGYDLAGRRMGVGGSYARTGVPAAASAASYNVNNQLTNWKGATLTYDLNGNLTSDGTNTYTWNARNQLVTISGAVNASFQYDAFGRRVSKNISGTTQFLYDGANPVQEISGSSASANLITGHIDEYFQRTDSAGTRSFLTDALGSTLALADSTGTVQTSYTFEPFGNTAVTGSSTTNSFAFTGREFDTTGLYFYRARYYNPQLQRFVSEDPIGFNGRSVNLYSYANNSSTNGTDPSGLTLQTNYQFFIDWLFETDTPGDWTNIRAYGKDFRFYGPDSVETQEMMDSPGILWANLVYIFKYGCHGNAENIDFSTIPAYLTTTNDPTSTAFQVGAFSTDIQEMPDGTLQYTMYNKAGWHSLLGGLNGNIGDHDRQAAFPMHEQHDFGGNIRQMFRGTGPNPCKHLIPGRK